MHRTQETLDLLKDDLTERKCEKLFCLEFDLSTALPLPCDYDRTLYGTDLDKSNLVSDD